MYLGYATAPLSFRILYRTAQKACCNRRVPHYNRRVLRDNGERSMKSVPSWNHRVIISRCCVNMRWMTYRIHFAMPSSRTTFQVSCFVWGTNPEFPEITHSAYGSPTLKRCRTIGYMNTLYYHLRAKWQLPSGFGCFTNLWKIHQPLASPTALDPQALSHHVPTFLRLDGLLHECIRRRLDSDFLFLQSSSALSNTSGDVTKELGTPGFSHRGIWFITWSAVFYGLIARLHIF